MKEMIKTALKWVKEHRKELIVAGVSIVVVIGLILAAKNSDEIRKILSKLKTLFMDGSKTVKKVPVVKSSFVEHFDKETSIAKDMTEPILNMTEKTCTNSFPFDVRQHVRNLNPKYHPSLEKIRAAHENGIKLKPNQTWVKGYTKGLESYA